MADIINAPAGETRKLSDAVAARADRIKYLLLAVVVLVIAALVIVNYTRRSRANREAAGLNQVFQSVVDMQRKPGEEAVAAFGKAAKDYAGLPAGSQAQLLQFAYAYNIREYATSEQAARAFIREYPKSSLIPRAKLALGQALIMQDKTAEAIAVFREVTALNDPETLPEAKLALAQSLEKDAETVRDNPDEYHRRLEAAQSEFNDIVARSQITVPAQRGFWPQAVVLPADYSLAVIKDKLAGHEFEKPVAPAAAATGAVTPEELESVMAIPPPADTGAEAPAEAE